MPMSRVKRNRGPPANLYPGPSPQQDLPLEDPGLNVPLLPPPSQYILPSQYPRHQNQGQDHKTNPEKRQLGLNDTIMLEQGSSTGFSIVEPNSELYDGDGRTYHGYDAGKYFLPNDGQEQDRLDLQHSLCHLLLHKQFGLAPFKTPPRRVLDVATGTGIWALEFAREHPGSHVVGTDLSMIQPQPDVPNCEFVRENSETAEWIFSHPFDYVHIRASITCFDDPLVVIRKAYDYLEPGGYIELLDPPCEIRFENDPDGKSALYEWVHAIAKGYVGLSRDPNRPLKYTKWLEEVGFVDVKLHILLCPISPWPEDPELRQIGRFSRADMKQVLNPRKFWEAAGYAVEAAEKVIEKVKVELDEASVKGWVPFYCVYGRKPCESEMTPEQKARWVEVKENIAQNSRTYPTPP